MNRELIINVSKSEITIALAEDKRLVELGKESVKTGFAVGDIYLGRVRKIMPGLNAAFVNIGHEKDAFIHYLDLGPQFASLQKLVGQLTGAKKKNVQFDTFKLEQPIGKTGKIANLLATGQSIVVQIAKEAISTKGPRLTSDISLAGRNVVLIPEQDFHLPEDSLGGRAQAAQEDSPVDTAQELRCDNTYRRAGQERNGYRSGYNFPYR